MRSIWVYFRHLLCDSLEIKVVACKCAIDTLTIQGSHGHKYLRDVIIKIYTHNDVDGEIPTYNLVRMTALVDQPARQNRSSEPEGS